MFGSTRVSRYQKGKTKTDKTNLDLLEQEILSAPEKLKALFVWR